MREPVVVVVVVVVAQLAPASRCSTPPERARIPRLLRRGLSLDLTFGEAAHAEVVLFVEKRTAAELGLGKKGRVVLGALSRDVEAGPYSTTLRVRREIGPKLDGLKRVPAVLGVIATDAGANETTDVARLILTG